MKKILILLILFSVMTSCHSKEINETDKIMDIVNGENIGEYVQSDIVLLYEIKKFLYTNFKITYDEMNNIHDEYFYIGPSFDDEYIKFVNKFDFTGLSIEESRKLIEEKYPNELEWDDARNQVSGDNKYFISITESIQGYDADESIVYVKIERDSSDLIHNEYWLYKYVFKEVDDYYKIFLNKPSFVFTGGHWIDNLPEEEIEREMLKMEAIYNHEGDVQFIYEFDLRKFCEENLY